MPAVEELSAGYGNFLLGPRAGPGVCGVCFNLTSGYGRCYACSRGEQWLDAMLPISYSVAHEQLHQALWAYKRTSGPLARRFAIELAAVLWRYLARHERCLAMATGADDFDLVSTVPAGSVERDGDQPLRAIVGRHVGITRARYERVLVRSDVDCTPREFDLSRYMPIAEVAGRRVLLIDDTWTSGASAQSAAAVLKHAGAALVAAVMIGRHVNREWGENHRRLQALESPFDWGRCAVCAVSRQPASPLPAARTL